MSAQDRSRHFLRGGDTVSRLDGRVGLVVAGGQLAARVRWRDGEEEEVEQLRPDITWLMVRPGLWSEAAGQPDLGLERQRGRGTKAGKAGSAKSRRRGQTAAPRRVAGDPAPEAALRRRRLLDAGFDVPVSVLARWSPIEIEEADRWLADGAVGRPGSPEFPPCMDELRWVHTGGMHRALSWASEIVTPRGITGACDSQGRPNRRRR